MSDEEETYEEEAEAEEAAPEEEEAAEPEEEEPKVEEEKPKPRRPEPRDDEGGEKALTETERAMQAAKKRHEEEESAKLQEYEAQRAIQREREEEELRQLKEKQEKRKKEREEEEKMLLDRKKEEDERRQREEAARLAKAEEKKKRKEQDNKKKLQLMAGQFGEGAGPNFTINKKGGAAQQFDKTGKKAAEPGMSKEELEAQKKRVLESLVQALNLDGLDIDGLRKKVKELHARICKLEADRYDLEKRSEHQEYDFKELTERQRQQIRNKALKKGLDPEVAAASKHPPKVATASKYDRQIDRRSYNDRQYIFASDKKPKSKKIFHGSARPPSEWGRKKDNEELELLRKNFEGHKYQETVKVEGAKPPMTPIPVQEVPTEEEEAEPQQQAVAAEE